MTPLDNWLLLIVLVQAHKEYGKARNCAVHWGVRKNSIP